MSKSILKGVGILAAGLAVMAVVVAAPVTMGIAIFDRSRGINDGVVIAAKVFFALAILSGIISTCLKGVCVQGINGHDQDINYYN
ncbi:MAG: hypothetical protein sL5_11140 [Candidatus Mesenet longicola]|uniref:Uncharacterized protein n=1 Tax=Candidatus Mesenet longicola TaxID=1892558 RepID=A0A8J3HYX6_9RICK|nr:MAG: hypothetical protein sGL2_11280 [Candidatus Mesenet longicola]GHM60121.1 MAG: hypothetical protein sL5_11140 [Candidatus Mesenet longicola]